MNLILIGYRGTGKSTVAQELKRRLGLPVVSMDQEITRRAAKTVAQIVADCGWSEFRRLERDLAMELVDRKNLIIDAGGGIVTQDEAMRSLARSGVVFWLWASPNTIAERLATESARPESSRPPLEGRSTLDEIETVLQQRLPLYREVAHYRVDTDNQTIEGCAREIERLFRHHGPESTNT